MAYSNLKDCVEDLKSQGQLIQIDDEVNGNLEIAEIHRRVYEAKGPALLFKRIKGCDFPAVSNIYGTNERCEYIFRDTLSRVKKVIQLKADPTQFIKHPIKYLTTPLAALKALPLKSRFKKEKWKSIKISDLPQIKSWPEDGGPFITLPQVLTLPPGTTSIMQSNVGMYRIQLSGNQYIDDQEIGMHYQLHRGIGVHHTGYMQSDEPFRVSIFVGGPPSHALAAIFPLPEGLSELTFAGMLAGRRFRYSWHEDYVMSNDADFVITGTIVKGLQKSEGPFGDHLGYYSLAHDFPVMKVDKVLCRRDAIWHFTVVGRPPQEDSGFGYLIHQLVGPLLGSEFPGVHELHAVDVAGVHPLLLAVGSERYMPFRQQQPEEILTQANRILGSGQTSLAKYLLIAARDEDNSWSAHNIPSFFDHLLERVDWRRDLHFQTKTTIDTLDYSGSGWNSGSKVIMACCGNPIRKLGIEIPVNLSTPSPVISANIIGRGILGFQLKPFVNYDQAKSELNELMGYLESQEMSQFPLIVLVDDLDFCCEDFSNFLWVTFTRSNPSHDIYGVSSFIENKHWGCKGPLIIDARIKPHHAPVLEVDSKTKVKIDQLFKKDGPLGHLNI